MAGEAGALERAARGVVSLAEAGRRWREARASEAQWYIVEAVEGKDFEVCRQIAAAGWDCWRPVIEVRGTRRYKAHGVEQTKPVVRKRSVFGRYVFLHECLTASMRVSIEQSPEVKRFLCFAGSEAPATVPDDVIAFYRKSLEGKCSGDLAASFDIEMTDRVRISRGPATGRIGVVKAFTALCARVDCGGCGMFIVPLCDLELVEKAVARAANAKKQKKRR